MLSVSRRSVQSARQVLDAGTLELIEATEQGAITVSLASGLTEASEDFQRDVVKKLKTVPRPMEAIRQVKAEQIRQVEAILPSGKYRVLYADPPWSYGNTQPDYHVAMRRRRGKRL